MPATASALSRTVTVNVVGRADTKGFTQAQADVDKATSGIGRAFSGITNALRATGISDPFLELTSHVGEFFASIKEGDKNVGKTMVGVGAAVGGLGALLSTAADRDKTAHKQLQQAIDATGKGYEGLDKQVESAIKTGEKYGDTANTTQDALTALTNRLGDPKKALDALGDAFNVAAVKHIPLSAAADLVGKAYQGNSKVLKQFGIDLGSVNTKTVSLAAATAAHERAVNSLKLSQDNLATVEAKVAQNRAKGHETAAQAALDAANLQRAHDTVAQAQQKVAATQDTLTTALKGGSDQGKVATSVHDALSKKLGGDASAAADTFTGHLHAMTAKVEDFTAGIGGQAGGALLKFGPALAGVGAIIETGMVGKLGRGIKNLVTFSSESKIVTAATRLWTAAQWAFDAAMDANPIILVTAAVIAIGVAVYEAYTHFKVFRDIVNDVGTFLKDVFVGAFDLVRDHIHGVIDIVGGLLLVFAPFLGIPILIANHWSSVVGFFEGVWGGIKNVWGDVTGFFSGVFDGVAEIVEAPFKLADRVINDIISGVDKAIDAINSIPHISTPFGDLGFPHIPDIPQLPKLAHGGITRGPTLALIGDNPGGREAVIPLPPGYRPGGDGSMVIHLTVQTGPVYGAPDADTAKRWAKAIASPVRDELLSKAKTLAPGQLWGGK